MKYRLAALLFCLELMVALPVMAQTKAPAPQAPPKAPAATPAPEAPPVLGVPPGYEYLPHGRRDPFVNPVPKPPPGAARPDTPHEPPRPPGLRGATVDEVMLTGVFVSKNDPSMSRAILQVPGLRAPVIASRGDVLFNAVIKDIRTDSVVFTKIPPGSKPVAAPEGDEEIKKLRSTPGDKK